MPLEGHPLSAPVDLRHVLRVGRDTDPDAIAVVTANVELKRQAEQHLHPHGLGVG